MSASAASTKRVVLPRRLDALDVTLEREKSVRARQMQGNAAGPNASSAMAKYEVSDRASSKSQKTAATHGKNSTKQHKPLIAKVAVGAAQRRASVPVDPTTNGTTAALARTLPSIANRRSSTDGTSTRAIAVKPQTTMVKDYGDDGNSGDGDGGDGDDGDGGSGDLDDEEAPASGYYDLFVQTRTCEDVCRDLGLTLKHIRRMKKTYDANDMYCTGEITQAEFFFMIHEDERPISRGLLQLGGVASHQKFLSFDQYARCVVRFASLTKPELFQFVFDLYDDDRSGALDEREFTTMSHELQSPQFYFPKNVATAIKMLGGMDGGRCVGTDDGLVDMAQFLKLARNFPVAFYPIVNMQKNVRAATLGESCWSHVVACKLRTNELLSYMRRHNGAMPELTTRERLASLFSNNVDEIRKRASKLYATELKQRRHFEVID